MSLNAVAKVHRAQERLIASREYMLAEEYPKRATTELRRHAMEFALEMCSIQRVKECVPIFIEGEMLRLVQHAVATLPASTTFSYDKLLFPLGMAIADQPLITLSEGNPIILGQWAATENKSGVAYLSWHDVPRRKWRHPMRVPLLWPFLAGSVSEGAEFEEFTGYGDPDALDDHKAFAKFMMTLWIMLQQRIAVQEEELRNPVLHRTKRTDALTAPRSVTVLRLRRPSTPDGREHEHSPVDWSHRWMVGGHWRNQFHPSTGEHAPTWIAPYIKGPDDKPIVLKERIYTFVR